MEKIVYPKNPEPLRIEFELTNYCNADCEFCPRENITKKGFMNLGKYKQFILKVKEIKKELWLNQKFKGENLPLIVFGGYGEPLLHKQFFDFLHFAKINGFNTELITNGALLNDKNCQGLIKYGLDRLAISLHTLDPKINKRITGINSLKRIAEALRYFDDKKIKIEIWRVSKFNGEQYNSKELKDDYTNFLRNFKNKILILGPTPAWNRGGQFKSDFYPQVKDSEKIRCQIAFFTINISFNGDFVLCCCDFSCKKNILLEKWDFDLDKLQNLIGFFMLNPPTMCQLCRKPKDDYYQKLFSKQINNKTFKLL